MPSNCGPSSQSSARRRSWGVLGVDIVCNGPHMRMTESARCDCTRTSLCATCLQGVFSRRPEPGQVLGQHVDVRSQLHRTEQVGHVQYAHGSTIAAAHVAETDSRNGLPFVATRNDCYASSHLLDCRFPLHQYTGLLLHLILQELALVLQLGNLSRAATPRVTSLLRTHQQTTGHVVATDATTPQSWPRRHTRTNTHHHHCQHRHRHHARTSSRCAAASVLRSRTWSSSASTSDCSACTTQRTAARHHVGTHIRGHTTARPCACS